MSETTAEYRVRTPTKDAHAINNNMRNQFAASGLEILKQAVLHVLYEECKRVQDEDEDISSDIWRIRVSLSTQKISQQLGIWEITGSPTLVQGILFHLREDKLAEEAGYASWKITEKGISFIENE